MTPRRPRRCGRAPTAATRLAALLPALVVFTASAGVSANESLGTTGLAGNGLVRVVPQSQPEVAVVAWSAPTDGEDAFVVANSTAQPVRVRKVVATATSSDGARSERASTRSVVPGMLGPGEQGLAEVRFRAGRVRADDRIAFRVVTAPVRARDPLPLATGSFVLSPPRTGRVAQTLDLVVTNDTTRAIDGRVDVRVVCLNEAGIPSTAVTTSMRHASVAPGGTVHASVGFASLCPTYVVGAEGRPAR